MIKTNKMVLWNSRIKVLKYERVFEINIWWGTVNSSLENEGLRHFPSLNFHEFFRESQILWCIGNNKNTNSFIF